MFRGFGLGARAGGRHAVGVRREFVEEGGQPARLARYTDNCKTLVDGMKALGFKTFLRSEIQAPIIVTFHAPAHAGYDFKRFYDAAKRRGFVLYPGKLTQIDTVTRKVVRQVKVGKSPHGLWTLDHQPRL